MTTASSLVAAESVPTDASQVWTPVAIPEPEWSAGVQVTTQFVTSVRQGSSGAETRRSLTTAPTRTVKFSPLSLGIGSNRLQQIYLERLARSRGLVPLWSDFALLTAAASATDTVALDAQHRRFVVGGRVAVFELGEAAAYAEDFELRVVDTVNASSLVLDSALGGSYPIGAVVVPLIEAQPQLSASLTWRTVSYQAATIDAQEVLGPEALDATTAGGSYPAGLDTHDSLPIWPWYSNLSIDVDVAIQGQGTVEPLAQGGIPDTQGLPRQQYQIGLGFSERSDYWDLLQFFEASRGRLGSFWMLSPGTDLTLLAINSATEIVVSAVGPLNDWTDRGWIGLDLTDGSQLIAEIDSVSRNLGQDTITLVDGFGVTTLADVQRCCLARRVRFASDTLPEEWISDRIVSVSVELIELHEEKTVSVGYSSLVLGPVGSALANGCGVSAAPMPPGLEENYLQHWWRADSAYLDGANGVTVPDEGAGQWDTGELNDIVENDTQMNLNNTVNGLQAIGVSGTTATNVALASESNEVYISSDGVSPGIQDSSHRFSILCVQSTDNPNSNATARLNEWFSGATIQGVLVDNAQTRIYRGTNVYSLGHPAGLVLWEIHQTGTSGTITLYVNGTEQTPLFSSIWVTNSPWTERPFYKPAARSTASLWCEKLVYCGHTWAPDSAEMQEARTYLTERWGL